MKKIKDVDKIQHFYENWEESMLWSCFQGIMGDAYVDDADFPSSSIIYVNCFAFAAGEVNENLVQSWYDEKVDDFAIIVARNPAWHVAFEKVGKDNCRCVKRYAIKKEKDVFDKEKLAEIVNGLDSSYELKMIDEELYEACKQHDWSIDFVHGYDDYASFKKYGLGVVVLYQGKMVAGASSYSSYQNGIEIEIDTKEDFRRRGLATICGAKLILECLKRDWYPSWDAQNKWSVALAEKLGYHYSHEYDAYEIWK